MTEYLILKISVLSGKSDSKIAEMELESRDLRIELAALKERHRVSERERTEAEEKNKDLREKVSFFLDHTSTLYFAFE